MSEAETLSSRRLVDVDLVARRATMADIIPYLDESWRGYLRIEDTAAGLLSYKLPESAYWAPSDLETVEPRLTLSDVRAHLSKNGFVTAVLNPGTTAQISGLNDPHLASALAMATNEWTVREWLDADDGLLGTIVVAPQDPAAAADEIIRAAAHPRMAQIALAYPRNFLGSSVFAPIHAAASAVGLPLSLQGNASFTGVNLGYAAGGHPESMLEYRVSETYGAQPHVASVIAQGVFDQFPNLRLVVNGFGVAWLPSLLWAMDRAHVHDAGRGDKRPSEQARVSVRVGSRGMEVPPDPRQLTELLELVNGHELLLPSSESPAAGYLAALPPGLAAQVKRNAYELFGEKVRAGHE